VDESGMREVLEAERSQLARQLGDLSAAPRDPMAAVSFGKRVGEGTAQAVERITQTSAFRSLSAKLRDVERALAKLDEGTYGACDACGALIPEERLAAIQWATLCVRCAAAR
jgi:DnaK suppressor protein